MSGQGGAVVLPPGALDALLPMHALIDADGRLCHLGPTLAKLAGSRAILGRAATEVLTLTRPAGIETPKALLAAAGWPLRLRFAEGRAVQFRGVLSPTVEGGGVLNLSLALSELGDLGGAGLTCTDFAPTDSTVDMLYLIEAKSAAMDESRRLITRLQGAKLAAEEQAFTDTLTGLRNRRGLQRELQFLAADRRSFAISNLDLDYFKRVNDRLGHAAGDHVLQVVARELLEAIRAGDTVARIGGDEFVIVFRNLVDPEQIEAIGDRIIRALERPIRFGDEVCHISASIGTAVSSAYEVADPMQMIADADEALYRSKGQGRAAHTIHAQAPRPPAGAGRVVGGTGGGAQP